MEENNIENKEPSFQSVQNVQKNDQKPIVGAIIIAGMLIAGAILLKGSQLPTSENPSLNNTGIPVTTATLAPVAPTDRTLGNPKAKVTLIMYEDFQCPWCGKFDKESEQVIRNTYVKDGKVELVFRDFPFLGTFVQPYVEANDESNHAAEAARCAGDQGKFWEYHDYLFAHQNGENKENFSVANLKSFAEVLGLDKTSFAQCLDSNKYAQAVADSKTEATKAGVIGTPKGFILRDGKIFDTIDGYLPLANVTQKIDAVLK